MATPPVALPEGFKLDAPAPLPKGAGRPPGLPEGFTLDAPPTPTPPQSAPGFWQNFVTAITSPATAGGPLAMVGREGLRETDKIIEKGAYEAGGAATDIASKAGAPPEVAAGAGVVGNIAVRSVPSIIGAGVGKAIQPVTRAAPIVGSRALMQSALKPSSKDIASGDAAKAIDTMLEGGFAASPGGVAKMRTLVRKLTEDVDRLIAQSTAVVNKKEVRGELLDKLSEFRKQVNPNADVKAILKSWNEFKHSIGDKIPVQIAQELKQGTYRILSDKYAHMGTVGDEAGTQAQMAIARGLRKGIEKEIPAVVAPNQAQSELINAIEIAERRAGIAGNRDIAGIAWLAEHPAAGGGMLADRSPWIKSMLAHLMHSGGPGTGATIAALYEAMQARREEEERERADQKLRDLMAQQPKARVSDLMNR